MSPDGSILYVSDTANNRVAKIDLNDCTADGCMVSTLATSQQGDRPMQIAVTPDGSQIYVGFRSRGNELLQYDATTGMQGSSFTGLSFPKGVCMRPDGAALYVTDQDAKAIKQISIA